jgi:hypothetical protein
MMQLILIGVGAGAASALLVASVASGTVLSIVLLQFAALPILIATIGWNPRTGIVAAGVAAIGLGVAVDWRFSLVFAVGVGAPAWWLGYLAMLARPGAENEPLEWYPAGRLVLWTAVLGALGMVVAILYAGFGQQSFEVALRASFERIFRARMAADGPLQVPGIDDPQRFLDVLVAVVPMAAAIFGTVVLMLNLWLSARVVQLSGRLRRPWPELPSMQFPATAAGAAALTLAGSFIPGNVGLIAGLFAVALLIAYGALGLAVLHAITRNTAGRPFMLGAIYALILVQGWPILIASLLGLIDSAFDLRGRIARRRGPPTINI